MHWNEGRIESQIRLIVVVTPLIAIMKDQVEHLNKIGVAAAMMGGDSRWMKPLKVEAVKLYDP